jgi:hypothetical protein
LEGKLQKRLDIVLSVVDAHGTKGSRLKNDARRLWRRVDHFLKLNLINENVDRDALELACYALQLPMRHAKTAAVRKLARHNIKDRAEEAAELLITTIKDEADESLLDRASRLLHELPQRSPMLDEARLLADAFNLEDFGVTGLILQAITLAIQGDGVEELAEGSQKQEQYGYWDARLKDGFHFEPIRQIARKRLEQARQAAAFLLTEMKEDRDE